MFSRSLPRGITTASLLVALTLVSVPGSLASEDGARADGLTTECLVLQELFDAGLLTQAETLLNEIKSIDESFACSVTGESIALRRAGAALKIADANVLLALARRGRDLGADPALTQLRNKAAVDLLIEASREDASSALPDGLESLDLAPSCELADDMWDAGLLELALAYEAVVIDSGGADSDLELGEEADGCRLDVARKNEEVRLAQTVAVTHSTLDQPGPSVWKQLQIEPLELQGLIAAAKLDRSLVSGVVIGPSQTGLQMQARALSVAGFDEEARAKLKELVEAGGEVPDDLEHLTSADGTPRGLQISLNRILNWLTTMVGVVVVGIALFIGIAWYYRVRARIVRTRGPLRLFDLIPWMSPRVTIKAFDAELAGSKIGELFATRIRYEMKFLDASKHRASVYLSAGTETASNLSSDLEKFGDESKLAAAALSIVQKLIPREQWEASGSLSNEPKPNATALLQRGSQVVAALTLDLPEAVRSVDEGADADPGDQGSTATDPMKIHYRALARGVAAWISSHMSDQLGYVAPRKVKLGNFEMNRTAYLTAVSILEAAVLAAIIATVVAERGIAWGLLVAVISLALALLGESRTRVVGRGWFANSGDYRAASAAFLHAGIALYEEASESPAGSPRRKQLSRGAVDLFNRAHHTDPSNLHASFSIGYAYLRTHEHDEQAESVFDQIIEASAASERLQPHRFDPIRPQSFYNSYVVRLHKARDITDTEERATALEAAQAHLDKALTWIDGVETRKLPAAGLKEALVFARDSRLIMETAEEDLSASLFGNQLDGLDELGAVSGYDAVESSYQAIDGRLEEERRAGTPVQMAYYNLACRNATLFGALSDIDSDHALYEFAHVQEEDGKTRVDRALAEAERCLEIALLEATEQRAVLGQWATEDPCLKPIRRQPTVVSLIKKHSAVSVSSRELTDFNIVAGNRLELGEGVELLDKILTNGRDGLTVFGPNASAAEAVGDWVRPEAAAATANYQFRPNWKDSEHFPIVSQLPTAPVSYGEVKVPWRIVIKDQNGYLAPGSYEDVVVRQGCKLRLTAGPYSMKSLLVEESAMVVALGKVRIAVRKSMRLRNGSSVDRERPGDERVEIHIAGQVEVGSQLQLGATLIAADQMVVIPSNWRTSESVDATIYAETIFVTPAQSGAAESEPVTP